ncbi:MAG: bifunctional riboflavin kinase/FAD synthetase [Anaerolineae bacterium]|nr:bifunctional riboflavin kinase/FAD synthetase [Anaerolineae bacterium]MDQ7035406.1 bifunctional riboflavin kinase/FAD synthetase [Anaerolineae bacterium]
MQHVASLADVQVDKSSVVTIGVFDGVHRGHQSLIKRIVETAHQANRLAVVLTFHPHPDVVLRDVQSRYYLTTPDYRARLLGDMGVDIVVTHPFDETIRSIRAADFVNKLVKHLHMKDLWVGQDFTLGYKREGNVDLLRQIGVELGYIVSPIELVTQNNGGDTITSTIIRELLENGNIEATSELLGRSYCVEGAVVEGDKRGRTIGFPTANMAVWEQQALPANGVYAGWAMLGDERFMAVTNVGVRPTFDGTTITIEPHLLDFDRDIYGEILSLTFETRLRSEQKFEGIDALKAQLHRDIAQGRDLLAQKEAN